MEAHFTHPDLAPGTVITTDEHRQPPRDAAQEGIEDLKGAWRDFDPYGENRYWHSKGMEADESRVRIMNLCVNWTPSGGH